MNRYRLSYLRQTRFISEVREVLLDESWGMMDLEYGIWLDGNFNPTKGPDYKYFIFPSVFLLLEKLEDKQ